VIKIDVTILIQFVNFCLLMAVLNFLLYRPLREIIRQRKATIEGAFQSAQNLETQIEEKMTRYQQQLQEAKTMGNQERSAMRQSAAQEEAKILGEAHGVANEQLRSVKERVAAEAQAARNSLKSETKALAGQIAAKVLGRSLS